MSLKAVPDYAGPYAKSAGAYWKEGWTPLPLPPNRKSSPPSDWTGGNKAHSGEYPSASQVKAWIEANGDGNIGLRSPKNVLGIDVDLYDGKEGAATLAAAEEEWGELPATWISTSRTDGSGIRFFQIPEGFSWPGKLPHGGGVELVRWYHRYAVVAPSVHPEGGTYHWIDPEGRNTLSEDGIEFPAPGELAELPESWVKGLTSEKKWEPTAQVDLDDDEVKAWLGERAEGKPCSFMERTISNHLNEIRQTGAGGTGKAAHDAVLEATWAVIGDAASGHVGMKAGLAKFHAAFKKAAGGRRGKGELASEWFRMLRDGVQKVAAEGDPEEVDPCSLTETREGWQSKRSGGSGAFDFARNDSGNARRFALRYRDEVRYVPEFKSWFIWSEETKTWAIDLDGEVTRMAMATIVAIEQEVQYLEEPKEKAALRKFINSSSNAGKLEAMLKLARDLKGMTVPADRFDSNRHQIVTASGTLILPVAGEGSTRVEVKPSIQEHYNTLSTGVAFSASARSPEWEKYLARFQPDEEVREWLQKLAGYSLLGENPRRLMIVAYGPTSTGKTTFASAMQAALGAYAGVTSMTIFRDNQDERPRPDLVKVLSKRFVYAEEASSSWRLHPDQIKRVTGGAPISARVPYATTYLDVVPAFTPWLLTNNAPTIEGADAALWRRLLVVPFFNSIKETEEDDAFESRLLSPAGRSAILAWLVRGYEMYLEDPGSLQRFPASTLPALHEFRTEVSDFAQALAALCDLGPEEKEVPSKLYTGYIAWCDEHHIPERDRMSGTKFGRELNGLGYPKKLFKVDGKPVWHRTGLSLKNSWIKAIGA